jgi:hypothetical protein
MDTPFTANHSEVPGVTPKATSGSALVLSLSMITVLAMMIGSALLFLNRKLDVGNQGSRWQIALAAAESGIDSAVSALNQEAQLRLSGTSTAAAWTGWVQNKTFTSGTATYTYHELVTNDASEPDRRSIVQIDKIGNLTTTGGRQWYRVRSMGTTTLPGASHISNDIADGRLRKVALGKDWAANRLFGTAPAVLAPRQVSRVIEAILEPIVPHSFALFGVSSLDFEHTTIDSYDSSDTANTWRTVPGSDGSAGQNGNVGTNAKTGTAIQSKAQGYVWGSGYTNGAAIANWAQRLRWEYLTNVYTPTPSITKPPFSTSNEIITAGKTITVPSTATSWANAYKVTWNSAMTLGKTNALSLNTSGGARYVIIYVKGDMSVASGNGILSIQNGVRAKFYIDGSIGLRGASVNLPSGKPGDLMIYGMKPGAGATPPPRGKKSSSSVRTISLDATTAAIYAPDHDADIKGINDTFVGSLVARNIQLKANPHTKWHYDEALAAEDDPLGYKIVSWIEDSWTANGWYSHQRGR